MHDFGQVPFNILLFIFNVLLFIINIFNVFT